MKKIPFLPATLVLLSGCANLPPELLPTGEHVYEIPVDRAAQLVEGLAYVCWEKSPSIFHGRGIKIDSRKTLRDSYLISIARYELEDSLYAAPLPPLDYPFFRLELREEAANSTLAIFKESSSKCSAEGECSASSFTEQSKRWLNGDKSCHSSK